MICVCFVLDITYKQLLHITKLNIFYVLRKIKNNLRSQGLQLFRCMQAVRSLDLRLVRNHHMIEVIMQY